MSSAVRTWPSPPASPRVAVTHTTRRPASATAADSPPTRYVSSSGCAQIDSTVPRWSMPPMVLPDLSRPCHGGDSPLPVVPCTLDVDGADPSAQRKDHIMTAQLDAPALDVAKLEEFAGKVAADQAAAYNAILVYLGDRVGLWRALASVRSATVADLAESSGVVRRYVQEWLSAQAANGYVTYDSTNDSFALSVEAAAVLAEEESPTAMMSGFELIAAVWGGVDRLAHVYTTGEGLAWHDQDPRLFGAVARFYGTAYRNSLL